VLQSVEFVITKCNEMEANLGGLTQVALKKGYDNARIAFVNKQRGSWRPS
jgi:hypothetical protein